MSTLVPFSRPTRTIPGRRVRQDDDSAVYTVKEVAALLRLSLGSTYALVRSGDIPARKMGGRWVIPKRRFHAWLDVDQDPPDDSLSATVLGPGSGR